MATTIIPENELPTTLELADAIEAAYPTELAECHQAIHLGLPLLIEADKEMAQYLFMHLRNRMRQDNLEAVYLDGVPNGNEAASAMQLTGIPAIIAQLRNAVRDSVAGKVFVLPHLDLLATGSGGLTGEAREVIALLYENPNTLFLGFQDPSMPLPAVIEQLFPRRVGFCGIGRDRIGHLVTQSESRKFGDGLPVYQLYKYASGLNAVRLRRLLETLSGDDYPDDPSRALEQLRQGTLLGDMTIPDISLREDVGGYGDVKDKLEREILDMMARADSAEDSQTIEAIEGLIPRGIIFYGPPGGGKSLCAKALASELGATVIIVSGPEIKSKWVGTSEANVRSIFRRARQAAPAVIVFDEADAIMAARGQASDGGQAAANSVVNQILTEMDGFRSDELVFVVATTNFVDILDPALLRPGRFEFHIEIGYPDQEAREAIVAIYSEKMNLHMSEETVAYVGRMTNHVTPDTHVPYTGDHLEALCRQIARDRLRTGIAPDAPTTTKEVDSALDQRNDHPELSENERMIIATHEVGHAVVAMHLERASAVERISMTGSFVGALGETRFERRADRRIQTDKGMQAELVVGLGGRECERLMLKETSIGSSGDLQGVKQMAMAMVLGLGMGPSIVADSEEAERQAVAGLIDAAEVTAHNILEAHIDEVRVLRTMLLEKGVIESADLKVRT